MAYIIKYRPVSDPRGSRVVTDVVTDGDGNPVMVKRYDDDGVPYEEAKVEPVVFPTRRKAKKYVRGMLRRGVTRLMALIVNEETGRSEGYDPRGKTQPTKSTLPHIPEPVRVKPVKLTTVEKMKARVRGRAERKNRLREHRRQLAETREIRIKERAARDAEAATFRQECRAKNEARDQAAEQERKRKRIARQRRAAELFTKNREPIPQEAPADA